MQASRLVREQTMSSCTTPTSERQPGTQHGCKWIPQTMQASTRREQTQARLARPAHSPTVQTADLLLFLVLAERLLVHCELNRISRRLRPQVIHPCSIEDRPAAMTRQLMTLSTTAPACPGAAYNAMQAAVTGGGARWLARVTCLETSLPCVEVQRCELCEVGVSDEHIERLALVYIRSWPRRQLIDSLVVKTKSWRQNRQSSEQYLRTSATHKKVLQTARPKPDPAAASPESVASGNHAAVAGG